MFRFDDRKHEEKMRLKELKDVKMDQKPKFKDLVSIMFAQYLIIIPVAIIGMIIFAIVMRLLMLFFNR